MRSSRPASVLLAGDPRDVREVAAESRAPRCARELAFIDVAGVALPAELIKGPAPERGAVAWLCVGTSCLPPIADFAAIERALEAALAD